MVLVAGPQDVAKFKEVLTLNNIPIRYGIFITSSTFSPRARFVGIKCIDGEEFAALERRSTWWPRIRLVLCVLLYGGVAVAHFLSATPK